MEVFLVGEDGCTERVIEAGRVREIGGERREIAEFPEVALEGDYFGAAVAEMAAGEVGEGRPCVGGDERAGEKEDRERKRKGEAHRGHKENEGGEEEKKEEGFGSQQRTPRSEFDRSIKGQCLFQLGVRVLRMTWHLGCFLGTTIAKSTDKTEKG